MNSAKNCLLDSTSLKTSDNYRTFCRYFIITFVICSGVMITIGTALQNRKIDKFQLNSIEKSTIPHPYKSHGPPYLAFIISSILARFNATNANLNKVLPGYLNIQHKQPVSANDSRMVSETSLQALSLLLTSIDLWNEIGAKAESELTDDDWIFIFEDDVDIVASDSIKYSYPEIYAKWNYSNPNNSVAGLN